MTQMHYAGQALEAAVRTPDLEAAALLNQTSTICWNARSTAVPSPRSAGTITAILCQASPQEEGEEALTVGRALEAATSTALLQAREAVS
jgi:hypothetical protein